MELLLQLATTCRVYLCDTFSFFAISQSWRDGQLPAFPWAHIPKTFIPAGQHLTHPKSEPKWIFVPICTAAKSRRTQSTRGFYNTLEQLTRRKEHHILDDIHRYNCIVSITLNETWCHCSPRIPRGEQEACPPIWFFGDT